MVLNTRSRAEVDFSDEGREIRLVEGEALFIVERDPRRAFRVWTEGGSITAIGTRFNVDRHTGKTRVSVIEGAVQVSGEISSRASQEPESFAGVRLTRGEQAVIALGRVVKTEKPDVPRAVAWRSRQLMFTKTPILEAAEEFNRYNAIQIRVDGEAVGRERIGGVFDADDIQTLVDFLAADPRFSVVRGEREIVIRGRR
jgi:transmembrane sensor